MLVKNELTSTGKPELNVLGGISAPPCRSQRSTSLEHRQHGGQPQNKVLLSAVMTPSDSEGDRNDSWTDG